MHSVWKLCCFQFYSRQTFISLRVDVKLGTRRVSDQNFYKQNLELKNKLSDFNLRVRLRLPARWPASHRVTSSARCSRSTWWSTGKVSTSSVWRPNWWRSTWRAPSTRNHQSQVPAQMFQKSSHLITNMASGSQISRILVSGFYPAADLLTSGVIVSRSQWTRCV